MKNYIFLFLFSILVVLNCYCQDTDKSSLTEVLLYSNGNNIKHTDTLSGPEMSLLTISLASENYRLKEAEYTVTLKRVKNNIYTSSGKGKVISLTQLGSFAQPGDTVFIEIKKMSISNSDASLKPSNGLFRLYLK